MKKVSLGILALIAIVLGIANLKYNPPVASQAVEQADYLPNPQYTPGAINADITQANIGDNICNPNWSTKSERPAASYTTALKEFQIGTLNKNLAATTTYFADYASTSSNSAFEEDHLISLELGGNPTDPANLWPEPYASSEGFGAKTKDSVENYLHRQVCSGAMTLAEAQREISTDWTAVYKTMPQFVGSVDNNDPDDN